METAVAVALLAIVPLVLLATTSFVKISVVFSLLRHGLGAGGVPGATVVTALAVILSLYVMAPVAAAIAEAAGPAAEQLDPEAPLSDIDALGAMLEAGAEPLRAFLERNAGDRERGLFLDLARDAGTPDAPAEVEEDDLRVLMPAFLITELGEAFQIGFLVLLPFLVVDLVVANILLSLGLQTTSPNQIAMPFKLLLFVLVDGWSLLARALVEGYA
ncbi:MAG: EscR/YscR/HrcR family type III secretion system export apparatus protein [Sandaracinaceae bacterium]